MNPIERGVLCAAAAWALAQPVFAESPADAGTNDVPAPDAVLPRDHIPRTRVTLEPQDGIHVGDLIRLHVEADAVEGDDVTVPDQSFAPLELAERRARVLPASSGRQTFVFDLELLALEPGDLELPVPSLRVVTRDGTVGEVRLESRRVTVKSLLGNEPNAGPKGRTQPVAVTQEDYTLLYVFGGLAVAALIALITWFAARWWSRRVRPKPPPPPPRPPWEIAVEMLAVLRRRKGTMLDQGEGARFVDEVSDVVRQYLGGTFGFDGLETTSDEMLAQLRDAAARLDLLQAVQPFLARCDLVKFAKVVPDLDEADLVLAKAQEIVQFSNPRGARDEAAP